MERQRKELLAAIQAQPADRTSQLAYGELLLRLDEPAEAARVFEQLVQTDQHQQDPAPSDTTKRSKSKKAPKPIFQQS